LAIKCKAKRADAQKKEDKRGKKEAQISTLREVKYTYTRKNDLHLRVNAAILEAFGISVLIELGNSVREMHKYMLLADWEVHIGKNCDRGLENAARGHSFLLYGPTPNRTITCLSFVLAVNLLTSGFVYATLSLNWLTRRAQTNPKKSN